MYKVFARKYRPSKLSEVVGQPVAVQILKNAIQTGKVHHAILLSGPMGTGKTSLARIISKSLNCKNGPTVEPCGECEACKAISIGKDVDVIEIDGASNRKVEDARAIIESVKYPPLKRRFKIYIIDEVHMLTQEAFNALLKTIEEPPDYVKFIFATTSIEKVPDTILSRCQILNLKRIPKEEIEKKLKYIAEQEKIDIEDEAVSLIAYASNGSLRVAEGYLDRCLSYKPEGKITKEDVSIVLGVSTTNTVEDYLSSIMSENSKEAIEIIKRLDNESKDLEVFCRQILDTLIEKDDINTEKKTALLNIFYKAMVDIKQKIIEQLPSMIVATQKAIATNSLEQIDSLIKKLSEGNISQINIPTVKPQTTQPKKEAAENTVNKPYSEEEVKKTNNQSAVDILLKTFGGKIINIEKLKK
ncbi:DNA polymerase III subunit gamma/tau [Hippea alviniae]|uniref:DNA polymerase III subunit gamma/tau n=1 Tax=Hippea alviniae TaxID=1279027 RepID=UPI0003B4B63A|nr:DNA polymerase III subunit gamma/tau [Hippea alviniae]